MKRRSWLKGICRGLSGLAIADLLAREIDNSCHGAPEDQVLPPGCHFPPRVKRSYNLLVHVALSVNRKRGHLLPLSPKGTLSEC